MTPIEIFLCVLLIILSIAIIYLYLLALFGITGKKKYPEIENAFSFLILIPAHNEEKTIKATIESLLSAKDIEKSKITVIADNCTDNTIGKVSSLGVSYLVREDIQKKGKGFALSFALSEIDYTEYEGVLIIDADTVVDENILLSVSRSFKKGYGAVQIDNQINPEIDTPLSQLQHLANKVENKFFYYSRSILQLPILLRGTGMAIKTEYLDKFPWDSFTVTEDIDYSIRLIENNVKIDYNINSKVCSAATSNYKQAETQKLRWASGAFSVMFNKSLLLFFKGIYRMNLKIIETSFSLFLLSRPSLIYLSTCILLFSLFFIETYSMLFVMWSFSIILLLIFYLMSGVFLVENKKLALKGILHIPKFGIWLLKVQILSLFGKNKKEWKKTERSG